MKNSIEILRIVGDDTPTDKRLDGNCAVCGSTLEQGGIEFKKVFAQSTFNMNHEFYDPSLKYICSHCRVFLSREGWSDYCNRNGKDPYFPRVEGKKPFLANWVFFSHAFYKDTHEIVKDRKRWRDLLTEPPEPPFCFVLSALCKKHLIFKTPIQHSNKLFQIRFDDNLITIDPVDFKILLDVFESLYSAGLSKSSIVSGNYNSSALLSVDRQKFISAESVICEYRTKSPELLSVCEFIGAKQDAE